MIDRKKLEEQRAKAFFEEWDRVLVWLLTGKNPAQKTKGKQ